MNSSTSCAFNSHLWAAFKASKTALKGQKWPKYHFFGHFWVCFVRFRKFSHVPIEIREKCRVRKSCSSFRSPDRFTNRGYFLLSPPLRAHRNPSLFSLPCFLFYFLGDFWSETTQGTSLGRAGPFRLTLFPLVCLSGFVIAT